MYATQFWIFSAITIVCLLATVSCFTATLLERPSIQQRNIFMSCGTVLVFITGFLLHYTGTEGEALLLGAKFEYAASICLLAGLYNSLASFYRASPNRLFLVISRILPVPLLILIIIATDKSSFWAFKLFFKSFSTVQNDRGLCNLVFERGPVFYCYMVITVFYVLINLGTFLDKFIFSTKKERILAVKMFGRLLPYIVVCAAFTFMPYTRPVTPLMPLVLAATVIWSSVLVRKEKFRNLYDLSFFAVVDSLYDPLFVTDTDFFVREANKAAKILFPEYHKASYKTKIQIDQELKNILNQPVYTMETTTVHIAAREFTPEPHRIERDGILYGYILVLNDVTEQSNKFMQLENRNTQLSVDYKEMENDLLATRSKIVSGIIQYALDQDSYIGEHMRRISNYTAILVKQLQSSGKYSGQITNKFKVLLCQVAPLHDVGKIILAAKTNHESDWEYSDPYRAAGNPSQAPLHEHVLAGAKLIERFFVNSKDDLFYTLAYDVALNHHEWWDGSGYPKGTSGKDIPLAARIVALANEFDNLTAKRPFTVPYSFAEAYTTILSYSGKQFDPEIVDAFKKARKEFLEMYNQVTKQNDTLENLKRDNRSHMETI